MKTKMCYRCGEEKSLDGFPTRTKSKDGHLNLCKVCDALKSKARRERSKLKVHVYVGLKKCSDCGEDKSYGCFSNNKTKGDGKSGMCKVCDAKRKLELKAKYKEKDHPVDGVKWCYHCDKEKPYSEFHIVKTRNDGRRDLCKICDKERKKQEREKNKNREVINIPSTKVCYQCGEERLASLFHSNRGNTSGVNSLCKICCKENHRKRLKTDPEYKMRCTLRTRLLDALRSQGVKKSVRTFDLVDCTIFELMAHLESKFTPEMNWNNHGSYWHIDHIRPCSSFNLLNIRDQKRCFHFSNLQPLYGRENESKSAKRNPVLEMMSWIPTEYVASSFGSGLFVDGLDLAIDYCDFESHSTIEKEPGEVRYFCVDRLDKCAKSGVKLIQIFEDEYFDRSEVIRSKILYLFNQCERIPARKTKVIELTYKEKSDFMDLYHLQGNDSAPVRLGLEYNGELVAVMTFGKPSISGGDKSYEWSLSRFCGKAFISVVGGFNKLLSHFIKAYSPKSIITYADRRWSIGNIYEKSGFKLLRITEPNYWYVFGGERYHRYGFRRQELPKKLDNFDPALTEVQNMENHGYNRIWDAGNLVYGMSSLL